MTDHVELRKIVARNLKILRTIFGHNVRDICEGIGISTSTYYTWEEGKNTPSLGLALNITEYMQIPFSALIDKNLEKIMDTDYKRRIDEAYRRRQTQDTDR